MSRYLEKYKIARNIDVDETADIEVAHKCQLFGLQAGNTGVGQHALYLKFYDKATAATVGTDTPVMTMFIASGHEIVQEFKGGIDFANGISLACTSVATDADDTAISAYDMVVNLIYK